MPNKKPSIPLFSILIIIAIVVIDQISKFWVVHKLNLFELGKIEISKFFDLTMVWNYGVSFGALRANSDVGRWALVGLAFVISLFFLYWLWRAERPLNRFALAMVIGGAIGNMIDRIYLGAVADFLDFSGLFFPWVFNLADAAVVGGAGLLILDMLTSKDEEDVAKSEILPNNNVE